MLEITTILVLVLVFIVGTCIGSFLNVVILRSLAHESIVFPSSKCPKCQKPLKWWHNIPIVSYIFLKGKCAFCKEPISIQYPIIELFTGIIFTVIFLRYGITFHTLFGCIISSLLIVIACTDIKERIIFDIHTYILTGVGLLYALCAFLLTFIDVHKNHINPPITPEILLNNPLTLAIFGIILGFLIMEILARFGYLFAGTRAFGEGDTLIAAALGAVFGWKTLIILLVLSVIIQVVVFIPIFLKQLVRNKDYKTLISFLSFVICACIFYLLQYFHVTDNTVILTLCPLILAIFGIFTCIFILKDMKDKPKTYLPFGPALVLAAFILMLM